MAALVRDFLEHKGHGVDVEVALDLFLSRRRRRRRIEGRGSLSKKILEPSST